MTNDNAVLRLARSVVQVIVYFCFHSHSTLREQI